jgi:hypothetical protein
MEWVEVLRQEADVGDIAAIGFPMAEEDDRCTRDYPLGNLVEGHGYHIGDWSVKQIAIGGEDFVFVLV